MLRGNRLFRNDTYRSGNAWFICDTCGGRYRRSAMLTQWDGLKVDARCLDPRPPTMTPPDIYPEGLPFTDARLPQDNANELQDDTYLIPSVGGVTIVNGKVNNQGLGALSPQTIVESVPTESNLETESGLIITTESGQDLTVPTLPIATPQGANVLEDDISIATGVIYPPSNV